VTDRDIAAEDASIFDPRPWLRAGQSCVGCIELVVYSHAPIQSASVRKGQETLKSTSSISYDRSFGWYRVLVALDEVDKACGNAESVGVQLSVDDSAGFSTVRHAVFMCTPAKEIRRVPSLDAQNHMSASLRDSMMTVALLQTAVVVGALLMG